MNTIRVEIEPKARNSVSWEDLMDLVEYYNFHHTRNSEIADDLTKNGYIIQSGDIDNWNRVGRSIFVRPVSYKVFDMVAI